MERIANIFTQPFKHLNKIDFFKRVMYTFLLVNAISLLPIAHDLFGYYGTVGTRGWNTEVSMWRQGSYGVVNFLSHPINATYQWIYLVFVIGQILFLILGLLRVWPIISSIMIWMFTAILFLKGSLAFTGGEVLTVMLLFYLMFIQRPSTSGVFKELQNVVNNAFYWILLIQVCLLYFFSSFYKSMDVNWTNGLALMYVSRIEAYSSGLFEFLFSENPILSKIAVYSSLGYQILFPFVVWIKKVKIPFLLFGIVFHLGTAIGMGVFTFGIVMILVYILFLEDEHIVMFQEKIRKIFKSKLLKSFHFK